jgi:hypothetical protein
MKKTSLTLGVSIIALISLTLTFITTPVSAQKNKQFKITPVTPSANLKTLEQTMRQMLVISGRAATANPSEREFLLGQLQTLASFRRQLLVGLMQADPGQVLQVALPDHLLGAMPEELQKLFEQRVELEGKIEVEFEDSENASRVHHYLNSGGTRLEMFFPRNESADLVSGQVRRVSGVQIGEALVVDASQSEQTTISTEQLTSDAPAIAPNTFGAQNVLLILVNFQDKATQPFSVADAQNVLSSTSAYYREASYGQTWLNGAVTGWYTVPLSSTTCNTSSIATYAKQAAQAAGYNLSNYNRFVYAFPEAACGWAGWGSIGGNPSQAWINGTLTTGTLSHELGHNFGLYHSRYLNCNPNITGVIGSGCSYADYGDTVDVMGIIAKGGHFNSYQKSRLGWLNYTISPPIVTVTTSGSYGIDAYETANSNPKALKILKSTDVTTGAKTWYWVEVRKPIGFDGFVSGNSNLLNGVVFHQQSDKSGAENYLLDMTPGSTSLQFDPALLPGQSFTDTEAGIIFTVLSVSSTGAVVNVSFGPQSCIRANPVVSVSPSTSQWVPPGSTVDYKVSVTNNDSAGCSGSSFDLQSSVPAGWSSLFDTSTLVPGPGSSATTTLHVASPSTTPGGYYNIGVTASNSGNSSYSGTSSVTCSILSGLNVTVTSDQASYSSSQTAILNATVTTAGSSISGAAVSFTITKPNGTKVTGSGTTGTNGVATFKYRFNKQKDPAGIYQVAAGANWSGAIGSGGTSFSLTK